MRYRNETIEELLSKILSLLNSENRDDRFAALSVIQELEERKHKVIPIINSELESFDSLVKVSPLVFKIASVLTPWLALNFLGKNRDKLAINNENIGNELKDAIVDLLVQAIAFNEWFKISAEILLKMAAYRETEKSRAQDEFGRAFAIALSEVETPQEEKYAYMRKLMEEGDEKELIVIAKSFKYIFENHRTGFRRGVVFAGRPFPKGWQPKTYEEWHQLAGEGLDIFMQLLNNTDSDVRKTTLDIFYKYARSLSSLGQTDRVIGLIETLKGKDLVSDFELLRIAQEIIEYPPSDLSAKQKSFLQFFADSFSGTDFHQRLRRWTGQWTFQDQYNKDDKSSPAKKELEKLAEQLVNGKEKLNDADIEWLTSKDAINAGWFWRSLGSKDSDWQFYELVKELVSRFEYGCGAFATYTSGHSDGDRQEKVEEYLNKLIESGFNADAIFEANWRLANPTPTMIDRALDLVEHKGANAAGFNYFIYGHTLDKFNNQQYERLFRLYDQKADLGIISLKRGILLSFILRAIERDKENMNYIEGIGDFALKQLNTLEIFTEKTDMNIQNNVVMNRYYWEQVAKHIGKIKPLEVIKIVFRLVEDEEIYHDEHSATFGAMQSIFDNINKEQKSEIWEFISQEYLNAQRENGIYAYRIETILKRWILDKFDEDMLIDWFEKHDSKDEAKYFLAVLSKVPSRIADILLTKYGDEKVSQILYENYFYGFAHEVSEAYYDSRIDAIQNFKWSDRDNKFVNAFIDKVLNAIKKDIERMKKMELMSQ